MPLKSEEYDPRDQLVPHNFDNYARLKPDAIYAEYTVSPISYEKGYRPITYKEFANAINGIAWWLTETLGPGNGEILPYIGLNDVRYPALLIGAVKAGYCMFMASPRNSLAAQDHLFKQLNCTKLLTPVPRPPPVVALAENLKLNVIEVPSVADLLNKEYAHFEYTRTYPEHVRDKLVVIHTSGTTGMPKPIFWTHESSVRYMRMIYLSAPEGYESPNDSMHGKRMFLTLPGFHAAGISFMVSACLALRITMINPTSGGLPTAAALAQAMKLTHIEAAFVVPSIVQEMAQDAELLNYLSENLGQIMYCGGDLPQLIGDVVASKMKLFNQYGSTEQGLLKTIHSKTNRDPHKDWHYVSFHRQTGIEFRPVTENEYELVMVRSPEREGYQVPFTIYSDSQEYHTSDLWVRHPDPNKPDLWRWSSRMDDIIVFLNGEKTNPVSMEQHIAASNAEISGTLVAGAQRFQACLIIELSAEYWKSLATNQQDTPSERMALIEKFWPSIAEANASNPSHARIAKTHILFTSPNKPMPRTVKGTIQRAGALKLYAQAIDDLYANVEKLVSKEDNLVTGPGLTDDIEKLSEYIVQTLSKITGWSPEKAISTDNFFLLGLDSLQAITAARQFRHGLDFPSFTPNLIYLNPSVEGLAQAIVQARNDIKASEKVQIENQLKERNDILLEYEGKINAVQQTQKHIVILTGSTGNLGGYILNALLNHPAVAHIHCLNRRIPTDLAQTTSNDASNGNQLDPQRITFWKTDLSLPDLGMQPEDLRKLQEQTTLVIHNAWAVNFNLSLSSYKPHLSGVVNLINFCSSAAKSPHLFFISSVSSVLGHQTDAHSIPEAVIKTNMPAPNGYGNSKYLAEQLLLYGAQTGSTGISLSRVGQITGAVQSQGLWNKNEWLPSLILSSLHVGALPNDIGPTLGHIDWIPIDLLAQVLVELALKDGTTTSDRPINVFHPVNLHPLTWEDIRGVFAEALMRHSGKHIETIPFADWIQRVQRDIESVSQNEDLQAHLNKNPAAKLLDFFEVALRNQSKGNSLETQITAAHSEKLRDVSAIKPEWIKKWLREWLQ